MLLSLQRPADYWLTAFVLGSAIVWGLMLSLPHLATRPAVLPAPVIAIDFIPWQPPAPPKPQKKPEPPAKPKPKPQPKKVEVPKPKPVEKPKPKPQPVMAEKIIPQEIEPPPEPVEEEELPEPVIEQPVETEEVETDVLPEPTPLAELTSLPRFLHRERPIYPPAAKASGREATVKLAVLIDADGRVRKVSVIKSAGDAFDQSAMTAMRSSSFEAARVDGKKVSVLLRVPVKYRLR
jgi:TonB family protein